MSSDKLVVGRLTKTDIQNFIHNSVKTLRIVQEQRKKQVEHCSTVTSKASDAAVGDLFTVLRMTALVDISSGNSVGNNKRLQQYDNEGPHCSRRYYISQRAAEAALWNYVPWEDYPNDAKQWVATLFGTIGEDDEEMRNHHPIQMSARAIVCYHQKLANKEEWPWTALMHHLIYIGPVVPIMQPYEEGQRDSNDGHVGVPTPAATPPATAAVVAPTVSTTTTTTAAAAVSPQDSPERWTHHHQQQQQPMDIDDDEEGDTATTGTSVSAYQRCLVEGISTPTQSDILWDKDPSLQSPQLHPEDIGASPPQQSLHQLFPRHFRSLRTLPPLGPPSAFVTCSSTIQLPPMTAIVPRSPPVTPTLPPLLTSKVQEPHQHMPDRPRPAHGYRYYYVANYDNALFIDAGIIPKDPCTRQQ